VVTTDSADNLDAALNTCGFEALPYKPPQKKERSRPSLRGDRLIEKGAMTGE
jgi:hypothetical protein